VDERSDYDVVVIAADDRERARFTREVPFRCSGTPSGSRERQVWGTSSTAGHPDVPWLRGEGVYHAP
jgi:hypothetical protein